MNKNCASICSFGYQSRYFIFLALLFLCSNSVKAQDSLLHIIIVSGQSNALNWHADAQLLESSSLDQTIPFYYHSGLPADRGIENSFNSSSDSAWTSLSYQTQTPFIRYNEHFFGPEITLARDLSAHIPQLAVFKIVYAGSNLAADWKKGINTGNQLYEMMLGHFNHATSLLDSSGVQYKIVGFFWMQGEADASNQSYANAYEANLTNFIQNIRSDVKNPSLKVVLGRIGAQLPSNYPYKEVVRTAQMKVANDDSLVNWVSIDDQELDTDSIHLLAEGVINLGHRMAEAWLNPIANSIETPNFPIADDFLIRNYPNPFNPSTTIQFSLHQTEFVRIRIFDLLGRELEILAQQYFSQGLNSVQFNAKTYASGFYIYEVQIGNQRIRKLMTLIK